MAEGALVAIERDGWRGRQRGRGRGETGVEQHLCDVPRTLLSDPRNLRRANECCVQHATETLSWLGLELICWLAPLLVMWPGDLSCCSSKWNLVGGPVKVHETKVGGGGACMSDMKSQTQQSVMQKIVFYLNTFVHLAETPSVILPVCFKCLYQL